MITAILVEHPEDRNQRADVVLGRRIAGLSRRAARTLARAGKLRIDGRRATPSTRVQLGQTLELSISPSESAMPTLEVLHVTNDFVYVNKPADVHTHRLGPAGPLTMADAVAQAFPECAAASQDVREGGAVHRLDHETTGVLAFARSRAAWDAARRSFEHGTIDKAYLALCEATTESWPPAAPDDALFGWYDALDGDIVRVRAPLRRGSHPGRVAVGVTGVPAETRVRRCAAIESRPGVWRVLVQLDLATGRRHQARVHLSWLGLPIVGDPKYGQPAPAGGPLLLHAWRLDLSSVRRGERRVTAPLPATFATSLRELGLAAP